MIKMKDQLLYRLDKLFIPGLTILIFCLLSYFKIQSLHAWQYTSDLFTYDQFLNELVSSNRMVEFTYGNLLGDHAYLFLFLFYPVKLLLKDNFVYFLLLLNPILFLGSSLLLFKVLNIWTNRQTAFYCSIAYLGGFGFFYTGLMEGIYGFHPDISAGFLFIGLACSILIQSSLDQKRPICNILSILIWLLLLIIKEETAILCLVFFGMLFLATKEKKYMYASLFTVGFILVDFLLIRHFQTPYNRSNNALAVNLLENIKEQGLITFFQNPQGPQITMIVYWGFLAGTVILFHTVWIIRRNVNPYLLALFYSGAVKIGFSMILLDFRLTSWHNLPGGVMIISALLLFIFGVSNDQPTGYIWVTLNLILISWVLFFTFEYPTFNTRKVDNYERNLQLQPYKEQINELSTLIPAERIVAVPMFSGVDFIGQRFTFYPGGIQTTPAGIADFAIIPRNLSHIYTGNFDNLYPIEDLADTFLKIEQTKNFSLYKRIGITQSVLETRRDFIDIFELPELIKLPQ